MVIKLPLVISHGINPIVFGLGCIHTSLYVGSTLVLLKNASDLESILEALKKFNVTTFAAIPATLTKILKFDRKILCDSFSNIKFSNILWFDRSISFYFYDI